MKKIIIAILVFLPVFVFGQNIISKYDQDKIFQFQGKALNWANVQINSLFEINPHYTDEFKDSISNYLSVLFDPAYIMPDGSDNYHTLFSDSTEANWFFVMRAYRGSASNLISPNIVKSGDALKWQIGDSIYYVDEHPIHPYNPGTWILCSSTDGFSGLTRFDYFSQSYMQFQAPILLTNALTYLYLQADNFDGIWPEYYSQPNLLQARLEGHNYDSITTITPLLNTNLNRLWLYSGHLRTTDLSLILSEAVSYYKTNAPTSNLSLATFDNDGTVIGDSCNHDLIVLDSIFNASGNTLTYLIDNSGLPVALDQEPYLTLPDTFFVLTNEESVIYDDGIAAKSIKENGLNVEYDCNIGEKTIWGYKFDEADIDTGFYDFTAYALAGCDTIDTLSVVVRLMKPLTNSQSKSILMLGDSSIEPGQMVDTILTTLTGCSPDMVGTLGTSPAEHEGNSGYRYLDYISDYRILLGMRNPFWDGSEFNFNNYRVDSVNQSNPIDFVVVQLGINSITTNGIDTAYIEDVWLDYVQEFVDSALSDTTANIILCMSPKCENTGAGWYANYGDARDQDFYIQKMQYMWLRLNEIYSGKRYAPNVYVSPQGVFIDRDNGYPKVDGVHANGVHPNASGYNQLSKSLRALIESIIKYE